MLEITPKTKIFIASPPKFATGGTELLHQLVDKFLKNDYDAYIYYGHYDDDPIAERFKKYDLKIADKIEDKKENILIIPEVSTHMIYQYKNIRRCIWWLSVDNYEISIRTIHKIPIIKLPLLKKIFQRKLKYFKFCSDKNHYFHLYQSYYANDFLTKKEINSNMTAYLSDYLNNDFLFSNIDYSSKNRNNLILYNPKKGIEFTKKLMNMHTNYTWKPLIDMTPSEISQTFKTSKVYIDFGNHPGKDRIPREAAVSGCCVLTNREGAAAFYNDVPIPDDYKFDGSFEDNHIKIIKKIDCIFANYEICIKDFFNYIDIIKNEEKNFETDLKNIFKKVVFNK